MDITIATPLYPPDIAEPAPYVKELATRLRDAHDITVVTYGYLPEKIPNVHIATTDKRQPTLKRIAQCTLKLLHAARTADIIYVQNGASMELPAYIISLITKTPVVIRYADTTSLSRAEIHTLHRVIQRRMVARADAIITPDKNIEKRLGADTEVTRVDDPRPRPEILPFAEYPHAEMDAYNASWDAHIQKVLDIFAYVR